MIDSRELTRNIASQLVLFSLTPGFRILVLGLAKLESLRHLKAQLPQTALLPQTAHVLLYFPHLADGGMKAQQWQTKLTFSNPNSAEARVLFNAYDDGNPVLLDFGSGPVAQNVLVIPPQGTRVIRSRIASASVETGWAIAAADLPVLGTVSFRALQNGTPSVELSASPTLPTLGYVSPATPSLGVAVANVSGDRAISVDVALFGSEGRLVGRAANLNTGSRPHVIQYLRKVLGTE